jgi:chemotaxis protein methyltransferase WspC
VVFARIAALLKEKIGLDAESIGVASIERVVRERLAACGLEDVQVYWKHLSASEQELQELIEAIVIPETWFFRDPEAFAALLHLVQEEWLPENAQGTLRILSLPCSTGEEPFSMAMALLDGGLSPERFHIDAIDISTRAIAFAQRAIYGKNSFRSNDLGFRDRYFEPVGRGLRLIDGVRRQVDLRHGNLLAGGWLHGAHGYSMIFCRNVLIYFDRPTQNRAIEVLGGLLTASGLLFVGPSETGLLLDHGFVPAGIALAFAFRQADSTARQLKPARKTSPAVIPARAVPTSRPRKSMSTGPPAKVVVAPAHRIEEAHRLANEGSLIAALECCERHLRDHPDSTEAFHLMGLLHDAGGDVHKAAENYRKALYLDPEHREALLHLAVALQKEGDARGAQRLIDRANRPSGQDQKESQGRG